MRALQFSETGGPEVLQVGEADEPHAGEGQIRVAVKAVAVNPFDWKLRSGMVPMDLTFPFIPGGDVAGIVDEVGDGVDGVAVGDEVFGSAVAAGSAEYAVLESFAAKPDSLPFAEAAGFVTAAETSVRAMDLIGVGDGSTVVINGAAGGVGSAAVQLAVARGARVIGTASEDNHDYLRSLGAEPTTYGEGLADRVRALAPAVDCAFDVVGHGGAAALVELTGDPQKVVTIADFEAPQTLGVQLTTGSDGRSFQALGEAAELYEAGQFMLPVAQTFPLEDAAEAHRLSQDGHVRGKLVLLV